MRHERIEKAKEAKSRKNDSNGLCREDGCGLFDCHAMVAPEDCAGRGVARITRQRKMVGDSRERLTNGASTMGWAEGRNEAEGGEKTKAERIVLNHQ